MHRRRLRRMPAVLEITAFLNLIVVLVPFLLSTAVFTRLAVIELGLPAPAAGGAVEPGRLRLEVVLRADAIEVGDRVGGLIGRLPRGADGHDLAALGGLLGELKARFPAEREASLLAEPDTPYDTLVQVMDLLRAGAAPQRDERFPQLSVGDAPPRAAAARATAIARGPA